MLNPAQNRAVTHGEGPLLVLAGAGSGKTRVITERIATLIRNGVSLHSICAVTFTNKAAQEMRERLRLLLAKPARGMYLGTFHSLGLKILREFTPHLKQVLPEHHAALESNFTIQSSEDQLAIIGEIRREFGIDPDLFPEKRILWAFSAAKNSGLPEYRVAGWLDENLGDPWGNWYRRYSEMLRNFNSVDFDDLILLTRDLLQHDSSVRTVLQERWKWFLADEFQDTNPLQFDLLRLLMSAPWNLCAVGDDDQSIYGWRGADPGIMLRFPSEFSNVTVIPLEQNYRSTQIILDLANATIKNNPDRHEKALWSALGQGEPATLTACDNTEAEAEWIASAIKMRLNQHEKASTMAILLRTNFQSRPLEEALRRHNIPYHLSGSYQFFDRKEIRDILAYLRFQGNHADERALIRMINFPSRGVSDTAVNRVRTWAHLEKKKLWDAICEIEICPVKLSASALSGILALRNDIQSIESEFRRSTGIARFIPRLTEILAVEKEFQKEGNEDAKVHARMANIRELGASLSWFEEQFSAEHPEAARDNYKILYAYLQYLALMSSDEEETAADKVQMMTLHLAKGLEFDTVFLAGLEDGMLPHRRSTEDPSDEIDRLTPRSVEEERRLFYVGITRARKQLHLSYSRMRKSFSEELACEPSRFLEELPPELLLTEDLAEDADLDDMIKILETI